MKHLLKIAGFAAGLLILLVFFDNIFSDVRLLKTGYVSNRDVPLVQLGAEEPGQVDVLCVGNSLGFCSITPMDLYRNYGFTSYNLSTAMQLPAETWFVVRKAIRKQPVKVILWEANALLKPCDELEFAGLRLAEEIRYMHPFTRHHNVWNNAVSGHKMRPYFKGYAINETVEPYTGGDYMDLSDTSAVSVVNRFQYYYFAKVKKLCDENGIKLVLFCNPSPVSYDMPIINGFRKFSQQEGVDLLDANSELEKVGIDWKTDTYDSGDHLNLNGVRKMTDFLAHYLEEECGLEDHRPDSGYRAWNELLPVYDEEVRRMEGLSYWILEEEQRQEKMRGE